MQVTDADYQAWVGNTESATDRVAAVPMAALAATLDRSVEAAPGAALPPLWHWLYFLPIHAASTLGPDGHPARGGFLPPITLPRRMWAGSRLRFEQPLRVGERVERQSHIEAVTRKSGRRGAFVLVTIRHEIRGEHGLALVEEQDLAYREAPGQSPPAPLPPPARPAWSHPVTPDPVLLFRYSALTFNGHRIHYDQPYATAVEGYPDLVVHGPLTATLLLEGLHRERPDARVAGLTIRAIRPLFAGRTFSLEGAPSDDGRQAKLWTRDAEGGLTMEITAELADL